MPYTPPKEQVKIIQESTNAKAINNAFITIIDDIISFINTLNEPLKSIIVSSISAQIIHRGHVSNSKIVELPSFKTIYHEPRDVIKPLKQCTIYLEHDSDDRPISKKLTNAFIEKTGTKRKSDSTQNTGLPPNKCQAIIPYTGGSTPNRTGLGRG